MSKAQNIADTIKWKKKRKNHFGDKCKVANCPICSAHKSLGNSKGKQKGKYYQDDIIGYKHIKEAKYGK